MTDGSASPPRPIPGGWRGQRWITTWNPEDRSAWDSGERRTAVKNLVFSIFTEHIGFSLWSIWSAVVVSLPAAGFHFTVGELFWLVSLPNLLGSFLRLPYTFAVARFGGRNWTAMSAVLLLIPSILLIVAVSSHGSFGLFVVASLAAGLGGGNFASSMTNITFFYPERLQGLALGLNAAGGNLAVAVVQLLVPVLVSIGTGVHLAYVGAFYLFFVVVSLICALLFMDNLTVASSDFIDQAKAVRRLPTWVISLLYIGTFGSFLGYSSALPLLIKTQFPHVHGAYFAWLGAAVGSLSRPIGGWLSDRVGGGWVTLWAFVGMAVATGVVVVGEQSGNFWLFFGAFLVVFILAGIGNGSTFRMVPAIFGARARQQAAAGANLEAAHRQGKREAAAVIGIASAIGALGGFGVTRGFASSIAATKVADSAFYAFIAFYVVCILVTWLMFLRRPAPTPTTPAPEAATTAKV